MKSYSKSCEIPHVSLGGSFSTGKTTVFDGLKDRLQEQGLDQLIAFLPDPGRFVLERDHVNLSKLSDEEYKDFQKEVYVVQKKHEQEAQNSDKKLIVSDASMVDVRAYSEKYLSKQILDDIERVIALKSRLYYVLMFPTRQLPIENDQARQICPEMQQFVHEYIYKVLEKYHIAYENIKIVELPDRVAYTEGVVHRSLQNTIMKNREKTKTFVLK